MLISTLFFSYDFLRIYDGDSVSGDLLKELTGNALTTNLSVMSNGPLITINLMSDDSGQGSGFSIEYSSRMFNAQKIESIERGRIILCNWHRKMIHVSITFDHDNNS